MSEIHFTLKGGQRKSMIFLFMLCCASEHQVRTPPIFLRDGILLGVSEGKTEFWERFVPLKWSPNETVVFNDQSMIAPDRASCETVFQIQLGDASRLSSLGIEANTDIAFSPDEKYLAIGTHLGDIWVVDSYTGALQAKGHFAEGMVKFVRWSNDGATLYAAEQSPDANLYALNPKDLSTQWTVSLADIVESSPLQAGEDVYGVYSLPAAYGLDVLENGDLIVTAAHGWGPFGGGRRNLSQVLRLNPQGKITHRWPEAPASTIMKHPSINEETEQIALILSRSADEEEPVNTPPRGVQFLSLTDLSPLNHLAPQPLDPYFSTADIWDAFTLKESLLMGLVDGRVLNYTPDGKSVWEITPTTPMMAGDVPIHASIGWGDWLNDGVIFTTSVTYIPFGAAVSEQRPPISHPQANRLVVVDQLGEEVWSWSGAPLIQGLSIRADGNEVMVGGGNRQGDYRRDAYGGYIFDSTPRDVSGERRLLTHCATEGPVFFRHALASDGRVALVELPAKTASETLFGTYRLSVMR